MSLKDKMKTYNFWISLVSAVVLIVRIIGDKFNFIVDTSLIMDITTGLCSIFVILGILSVPKSKQNTTETQQDTKENIQTIISNINSGRELINQMENQFFNNQTQTDLSRCNPEMPIPSQEESITILNTEHNFQREDTEINVAELEETTSLTHKEEINSSFDLKASIISPNENVEEVTFTESEVYDNTTNNNTNEDLIISNNTPAQAEDFDNNNLVGLEKNKHTNDTSIQSLSFMLEALKNNLDAVAREFDNYTKSLQ